MNDFSFSNGSLLLVYQRLDVSGVYSFFFSKIFFHMNHLQGLYCICYNVASVSCFGCLVLGRVIESPPSALEGEVLAREVPVIVFLRECHNILSAYQ